MCAASHGEISSTQRTWRDHHMTTVAYGPLWDRLRTDASERLRCIFASRRLHSSKGGMSAQ
eukprot:2500132-Pyramimonas_sp.AAC.1